MAAAKVRKTISISQVEKLKFGFVCEISTFGCLRNKLSFWVEIDAHRIDAVPLPCGFPWPVVKNMPQMTTAVGTDRFRAYHAVTGIPDIFDGTFNSLVKRGPSATTFKFVPAFKQLGIAGLTMVASIFKMEVELSCIGSFCALLPEDIILLWGKLLFPFFFGLVYSIFFVHSPFLCQIMGYLE